MKKSQLSDKQLEELLRDMPKVKDHRDPRDIYQNIAPRVRRRTAPSWLFPSVAAAAVMVLAFILSPGLFDLNQAGEQSMDSGSSSKRIEHSQNEKTAFDKASLQDDAAKKENAGLKSGNSKEDEATVHMAKDTSDQQYELSALYPGEADGQTVITYEIPDGTLQTLIPITVAVPPADGGSWIDSFIDTMAKLKEEEWGLEDYYPLGAGLSYDPAERALIMDFEQDHGYQDGSTNTMLFKSLEQALPGKGVKKLLLSTEGNPGVPMGNYDMLKEYPIPEQAPNGRAFLFFYPQGKGEPYLVPTDETFDSVEPAFEQMKKRVETLNLEPSLPESLTIEKMETDEENKILTLHLNESMELDDRFLPNLEAILLTAKEFGYEKVKIEGSRSGQIGPFNLSEPIQVPEAPNKMNLD